MSDGLMASAFANLVADPLPLRFVLGAAGGWLCVLGARWLDVRTELLLDAGWWAACRMRPGGVATPAYPWAEIGGAAAMSAAVAAAKSSTQGMAVLFLFAHLLVCGWVDWRHRVLPDVLVLPLLVAGAVAAATVHPFVATTDAVCGAAAGFFAPSLVRLLRRGNGLGFGDVKFLAAIGAWLGPLAVYAIFLSSSILALLLMAGRRAGRAGGDGVPFGPFLAATAALWVIVTTSWNDSAPPWG